MFTPLLYISGFNQTHLWRRARHNWLFVYILVNGTTSFIQPLTYSTRSSKQQNSRHTTKDNISQADFPNLAEKLTWPTWKSCRTEKKFTVACIMFSLAFLEWFTLVLGLDIVRFMYFHNLIPPFFWSRYEQEAHGISYSSKLAIQNEQKTNVPSSFS
jgi:hypothetical protein